MEERKRDAACILQNRMKIAALRAGERYIRAHNCLNADEALAGRFRIE